MNNKTSKIIIHMTNIDNANRFMKRLQEFCAIAAEGGDTELLIRHNGSVLNCGFVAHDLNVAKVTHYYHKDALGMEVQTLIAEREADRDRLRGMAEQILELKSGTCECSVSICDTVVNNNKLKKEIRKLTTERDDLQAMLVSSEPPYYTKYLTLLQELDACQDKLALAMSFVSKKARAYIEQVEE